MFFDNDKYFSIIPKPDDELELHDNMKYAIGEVVLLTEDTLKWDRRLYHPNRSYEKIAEQEPFIIFERIQQNRKSPTRGNLTLRNHLYGVVKADNPTIVYSDLTIEKIRKLNDK